jgi:hypothetical protein
LRTFAVTFFVLMTLSAVLRIIMLGISDKYPRVITMTRGQEAFKVLVDGAIALWGAWVLFA